MCPGDIKSWMIFFRAESYNTHFKPLRSSLSISLSCIMIMHRLGPASCVHFRQGAGSCSAFKFCIAIHFFQSCLWGWEAVWLGNCAVLTIMCLFSWKQIVQIKVWHSSSLGYIYHIMVYFQTGFLLAAIWICYS